MTTQPDWNPDRACEEMADLFKQADQIISQPHYQKDDSADSLDGSSADSIQRQEKNSIVKD